MAEVAKKILVPLREDNPAIHEDTSGTLPAARLAYSGEHGDPTTPTNEPSVVSYDPATDDAPQWHPLSDLIKAAPSAAMTGGTTVCPANLLEYADLEDPGWQDIASAAIGGGSGRMTVSASVPLSLYSPTNTERAVAVRLVIDGYPTTSQSYTFATDSTAGNVHTFTFPSAIYSVGMLAVHRVRVQVDRAPGSAAAVVYTGSLVSPTSPGPTITITVQEGEPLTTGGDLSGPTDNATVIGLYGRELENGTPTSGDVYAWNGTQWALTAVASPIIYDGDMIYGSGYVAGAPGANVALPANATITANSTVSGSAANIIDSNSTTTWRGLTNGYFTMDFGAVPPTVRGWRLLQNNTTNYRSTSVALQGSNDNSTYTTIDTWTTAAASDSGTRDLGADYTYRYWRMRSASATLGWIVATAEIFETSTVLAEPTRLPIGTAGQILSVNAAATAPEWVENSATGLRVLVRNDSGASIPKHSIVYLYGASGQKPTIRLAQADSDTTSARTLGWTVTAIDHNSNGYVQTMGPLYNVNTSGMADGDSLHLSPTVPGGYTTTAPSAPDHDVRIGIVVKGGSVGGGQVEVFVQNGYELNELHDVHVPSPSNGQVLTYSSANLRWEAVTPSGGGGGGAEDLVDLGDVNITTPVEGDLLRYNDSTNDWENFPEADLPLAGDVTGTLGASLVEGIQGTPVSATAPTTANQAIVYDGAEYRPYRLKASDLATILTPIFNEDGTVVFDEDGVILAEVNN